MDAQVPVNGVLGNLLFIVWTKCPGSRLTRPYFRVLARQLACTGLNLSFTIIAPCRKFASPINIRRKK